LFFLLIFKAFVKQSGKLLFVLVIQGTQQDTTITCYPEGESKKVNKLHILKD